jgi:RimJ/RimL family protein N-acetyltransferase
MGGKKMIYGKRIRLRAIERTDLPVFVRWLNDPEVIENLLVYIPMSLAQEEGWFERTLTRPPEVQPLCIETKEKSNWKLIGNLSFMDINQLDRSTEIGILIGEKGYWDKGYGTEAMQVMVQYGFNELNLNRIWLRVYDQNKRGIRAYEKAGFIKEGTFRQGCWVHGKFMDVHFMSVLRSEWKQKD